MSETDQRPVFILTGKTGSGKTTLLLKLVEVLRQHHISVAGFAAVAVPGDAPSDAYHIHDLESGHSLPLASRKFSDGWERTGNFYFDPEGIRMGKKILEDEAVRDKDLVIMDEIGPFELEGGIWAAPLTRLLTVHSGAVLLVVRESLVPSVLDHWDLDGALILAAGQLSPGHAADLIMSHVKDQK
jgi:nucleoside-triphosphatase